MTAVSACGDLLAPAPLNQTHFELLMSKLTLLGNGISENNKLIQTQSRQIASCVSDIADLRAENAELRDRVARLETALTKTSTEHIYSEM